MTKHRFRFLFAASLAIAGCGSQIDLANQDDSNPISVDPFTICATAAPSAVALAACPIIKPPVIPGTAPSIPSQLLPEDGKRKVALKPLLSWFSSDRDAGDVLTFAVSFGTAITNMLVITPAGGITAMEFELLENLDRNTTYFWQVIVRDKQGHVVAGPIASFTTEIFAESVAYCIAT
ncbi:MAG: hypothetical protein V1495_05645, partial [Pseudomonadota bacterium]